MRVVIDEIFAENERRFENWYEVYVVDENGNIVADSDEIYSDPEKAFEAVKRLVKEHLQK